MVENAHRAAAKGGELGHDDLLGREGAGFPDSGSLAVTRDCKIVEWLRELRLDPAHAFVKAAREDDVCVFEQTERTEIFVGFSKLLCSGGTVDTVSGRWRSV